MKNEVDTRWERFLSEISRDKYKISDRAEKRRPLWKPRLALCMIALSAGLVVPELAHGQFLGVFNAIFGSIENDIGVSLSSINQSAEGMRALYQRTVAPLAAINQARGFVANSIASYRAQMNQVFYAPFTSAVTPGPQQLERILHSRESAQVSALQTSFTSNYGAIPVANSASPQDRVLMDVDDALGEENLKTTLIADQGADTILLAADQMENQVAISTPGSNPFLTAHAQVANLRCQAYLQKMLAAELRQEAGRIAHDNVLIKRKATAAGGINSLVTGALTSR